MTSVAIALAQVHQRIAQACAAAGRPVQAVTLLAVSKTFGADAVRSAFAAGQRSFGEITARLAERYAAPQDEIAADSAGFLGALRDRLFLDLQP